MNIIILLILSTVPYITTYLGLYYFSNAWLAILAYHFVIIVSLVYKYKDLSKISYSITSKKLLSLGIIITASASPIIYLLWDYIKLTDLDLVYMLERFHLTGSSSILFILYFFLVHPILEELYWRFVISYTPNQKIEYLFDILFAGYHILVLRLFIQLPFAILSFIILAIAGMSWGYIKERYNDYITIFITHAIADLLIILTVFIISNS